MKRNLLMCTASLALVLGGFGGSYTAFAQTDSGTQPDAVEVQPKPDVVAPESSDMSSQAPAEKVAPGMTTETDTATETTTPAATPDTNTATETTKPVEGTATATAETGMFFTYEAQDQYRSSDLIGRTITNAAGEAVGDVNDLIATTDGRIEGVIVGVGGFLGIGEKNVGVNFSALEITEEPDSGDTMLVLNTTREEIEAAPAFVTKKAQEAAAKRQQEMQDLGNTSVDTTATGSTGETAPAQ